MSLTSGRRDAGAREISSSPIPRNNTFRVPVLLVFALPCAKQFGVFLYDFNFLFLMSRFWREDITYAFLFVVKILCQRFFFSKAFEILVRAMRPSHILHSLILPFGSTWLFVICCLAVSTLNRQTVRKLTVKLFSQTASLRVRTSGSSRSFSKRKIQDTCIFVLEGKESAERKKCLT